MLTGGKILREKLILSTGSDDDLSLIRSGLAGRNACINIPPYGNQIIPINEDHNLILRKASKTPFAYEEVRTLIKKIQAFGRSDDRTSLFIIEDARLVLESSLTIFFPSRQQANIEVSCAYNWISLHLNNIKDFKKLFAEMMEEIAEHTDGDLKIFSNDEDTISIHNYAMEGIYLKRDILQKIFEVFTKHGLIERGKIQEYVMRTCAFCVKAVIFMEARQQCQYKDERFDIEKDKGYNPVLGDKVALVDLLKIVESISENANIARLPTSQISMLVGEVDQSRTLQHYGLINSLKAVYQRFINDFADEVKKVSGR